jgi:hypothetical protein
VFKILKEGLNLFHKTDYFLLEGVSLQTMYLSSKFSSFIVSFSVSNTSNFSEFAVEANFLEGISLSLTLSFLGTEVPLVVDTLHFVEAERNSLKYFWYSSEVSLLTDLPLLALKANLTPF